MNNIFLVLIRITILIFLVSCQKNKIQDLKLLNKEYANSFKCPFKDSKVIVQQLVGVCGNMDEDDFASMYIPSLYDNEMQSIIQRNTSIDSVIKDNDELYDSTKVYVEISGFINPKTGFLEITEKFEKANEIRAINKLAVFKNNKWDIKLIK